MIMRFAQKLRRAKDGDHKGINSILIMYQLLSLKNAVLDGRLGGDLYQELCITLMRSIQLFKIKGYEKALRS